VESKHYDLFLSNYTLLAIVSEVSREDRKNENISRFFLLIYDADLAPKMD
jgi:hypothetical protein